MNKKYPDYLLNISLSGATSLLLALSFPPYDLWYLAWFAFVPLFFVICHKKSKVFICLLFSGILYYVLLLNWVQVFHYLSLPFISIISGLFFFALPLRISVYFYAANRPLSLFIIPSLWVVFEYLKTSWPLPFAFGVTGYSQYTFLAAIQISDIAGIYGISFLIMYINIFLYLTMETLFLRRNKPDSKKTEASDIPVYLKKTAFLTAVIITGIAVYGYLKLNISLKTEDLTIKIIQTNHKSDTAWLPKMNEYLTEYENAIIDPKGESADLTILPENAVKTYVSLDKKQQPPESTNILNRLSSISRRGSTALLFGTLEAEKSGNVFHRFNSAFLFDRHGNLTGRYRKTILVPFGEEYPFGEYFKALDRLILNETSAIRLKRGSNLNVLKVSGRKGKKFGMGVIICYEGTDGKYVRQYSLKKADFLVNLTSDAWTKSRKALLQHASFGVFRAIENRMPYLRIGNGGLSCVISPLGKITHRLPIFQNGVMAITLMRSENHSKTIYSKFGDWFVILCLILTITGTIYTIRRGITG